MNTHNKMWFSLAVLFTAWACLADVAHTEASSIRSKRLVGGSLAPRVPWQAMVYLSDSFMDGGYAGGALISDRWVLTAGRNLFVRKTRQDTHGTSPIIPKVYLGILEKSEAGPLTEVAVEKVVLHPAFQNHSDWDNDLALLKLKEPVVMSDKVSSISLPKENQQLAQVFSPTNTNRTSKIFSSDREPPSSPNSTSEAPTTWSELRKEMNGKLSSSCLIFFQNMEHIQHVRQVLQRLLESKLFAITEKCEFHVKSVEFLGYIIDSGQMRTDPGKIQAVADWPIPTSLQQLQWLLGFANFHRRIIRDYSSAAVPLSQLTSSATPLYIITCLGPARPFMSVHHEG